MNFGELWVRNTFLRLAIITSLGFSSCGKEERSPNSRSTNPSNEESSVSGEVKTPKKAKAERPSGNGFSVDSLLDLLGRVSKITDSLPPNRPTNPNATTINFEDLAPGDPLAGSLLVHKQFIEKSECNGDSIFTEYYSNGIISEYDAASIHFLGDFRTGRKGLTSGASRDSIQEVLGTPRWSSDQVDIYQCADPVERELGHPDALYECGWFFFENGRLIGVTFKNKWDC